MWTESLRSQLGSACFEKSRVFQRRRFATIRCHNNNNNSVLLRKQAPGPPRLFPAHVSCSSLSRATAISKPSHGKRLEAAAKVNISSSPPSPREGLGAALGLALDAHITANPAGMLRAPARQPGEVVEKPSSPWPEQPPHGRKRFLPCSFSVLGWLLASPGAALPLARPQLSRLWQPRSNSY